MAALDVFVNTITAQAIVAAADKLAGSPGYYLNSSSVEDLTAPAYIELQALCDHLATWFDWPFRDDAVDLTVSARATGLPHDFWRAAFSTAYMVHPVTGGRTPLLLIGTKEFHDRVLPSTAGTGLPERGTVMRSAGTALGGTSAGTLYVDPSPDISYLCELHYDPMASPLSGITSVPWFPSSKYLITALAARLCAYQDDTRALALNAEAAGLLADIQRGKTDVPRSHTVQYDELMFRRPIRLAN